MPPVERIEILMGDMIVANETGDSVMYTQLGMLQMSNNGTIYTCRAFNGVGQNNASFELIVQGLSVWLYIMHAYQFSV